MILTSNLTHVSHCKVSESSSLQNSEAHILNHQLVSSKLFSSVCQIISHETVPFVILFLTYGLFFDLSPPPMSSSVFCPPFQAPINAQMLAQRQREILNQHLRQRQMHQQQQVQQRTLMMRGQGLNMAPSVVAPSGVPATMSSPRVPQANAQQFPFPPNYGTGLTPPPPFTSPFSPVSPSPGSQLLSRSSLRGCQMNLANRGMLGNLGGPLGPVRGPQVQHGTFQSLSSGAAFALSAGLSLRMTGVGVRA